MHGIVKDVFYFNQTLFQIRLRNLTYNAHFATYMENCFTISIYQHFHLHYLIEKADVKANAYRHSPFLLYQ